MKVHSDNEAQSGAGQSAERIVLLDALRLLAALLVLAFHWLFRGPAAGEQLTGFPALAPYATYGYIGVDWFFVISGFVIAWTATGRSGPAFAVMRFARLYPGFVACMSVTVAMTFAYQPAFISLGLGDWLANLTMFAPAFGRPFADGAYWSIVVELVFYGWVLLTLAFGLWPHRLLLASIWLAVSVLNIAWLHSVLLKYMLITDFAPWFVIGIVIHEIWKSGGTVERGTLLASAFIASCLSLLVQIPLFVKNYGSGPDAIVLMGLNGLGIALVLVAIGIKVSNANVARASAFAGAVSYPLYLFHQHAGYMLIDRMAPAIGSGSAALITLVAVVAVAWSTSVLIERPLRGLIIRKLLPWANRMSGLARPAMRHQQK